MGGGTRPGWGKGDRHHVHTGPPGHSGHKAQGKERAKRNGQDDHQQGKNWKHDDDSQGHDNHQGNDEQHGNGHQGGEHQGGGHGGGGHQDGDHGNHD